MIALAIAACGSGSAGTRFASETQSGQSLVGTWDTWLSLDRPYQLELREPAARRICGTIGFVDNHHVKAGSELAHDSPRVGVYDLDLSLLGLDWLGDSSFPTAAATTGHAHDAAAGFSNDSVAIVLNPGSQERIVLTGRYYAEGISGYWLAQSSRGTASGSFSMSRHVNARTRLATC